MDTNTGLIIFGIIVIALAVVGRPTRARINRKGIEVDTRSNESASEKA